MAVLAGLSGAKWRMVGRGSHGGAGRTGVWSGLVWFSTAWQAWLGAMMSGPVRRGWFRYGRSGEALPRLVGCGQVWRNEAWQPKRGEAWRSLAWHGWERHGSRGEAR